MTTWTAARDGVRRLCTTGGTDRALRAAILRTIRAVVPFDYYVWAITDPVTGVGASPLAEIPSLADLPRVIANLRSIGYRGPLSLELFNPGLWAADPLEVVRRGLEGVRALVEG